MNETNEFGVFAGIASKVITGILAIIILISVFDSFTIIPPGYVGVLFNRWSGSLKVESQGMALMIPFATTVQKYPVALRTYTMVAKSNEGSAKEDDSIDLPTREGQHIRQDISVTYNTTDSKAADVFRAFNGSDISAIENSYIRRTIITMAQNIAGSMSLSELISSQRDKLQDEIQRRLGAELAKMGFTLDKVNLGASHLPQAIEAQMQQKMAAQQQAQQAEYELQKQQMLAKAKVAEAEGTAQARTIQAKAEAQANDTILQKLSPILIEYKKIEKWNGALPMYTGTGSAIINMK